MTLERRYKGYEIIAKTRAVGYPWTADTIIQLREIYGNMITLQSFASVEQLRKCKGW